MMAIEESLCGGFAEHNRDPKVQKALKEYMQTQKPKEDKQQTAKTPSR